MSPKGYTFGYEKQWVGIDVCQKSLDVYIRPSQKLFQVANNEVGIRGLVQTFKNIQPELIVLEAQRVRAVAARRLRSFASAEEWKLMQQSN